MFEYLNTNEKSCQINCTGTTIEIKNAKFSVQYETIYLTQQNFDLIVLCEVDNDKKQITTE